MNKKILRVISILVLGAWCLTPYSYAKPERMQIKSLEKKGKEKTAKAQIKNIDLRNIEDPEARRAIREILNYLDLQVKK